mmetsp:Transcript_75094/g.125177  ORF Transcript_75094/g.125177 Transcript_75094/m.125177 type:complete len:596 (+) Transcript_75094:12-1799(+)
MYVIGTLSSMATVQLRSGFVLVDDPLVPPVGTTGNGTCGAANRPNVDCNLDKMGYFPNIASLQACVTKVKPCKMGTFVSWSPLDKSCSWFNECDWDHLCVDCSKDTEPSCPEPKCPYYIPFISEVVHAAPSTPCNCRNGTQCGGTNEWVAWKDTSLPNKSYTNPGTMPYPKSNDILAWEFKSGANPGYGGADVLATSADTWFPSWARDGNLYTGWTDGSVKDDVTGKITGAQSENKQFPPHDIIATGQATVVGDDPFELKLQNVSVFPSSTYPYNSRFPCGSLVYNGTWFYGTYWVSKYGQAPYRTTPHIPGLIDFRHSTDKGKHWIERRFTPEGPADDLFTERDQQGHTASDQIKFATPHWVDFGQELEHSPDGKAYLISHGNDASSPESAEAWMLGNQVFLARVEPTIADIEDGSKWEFYAGGHGADAKWVKGDVRKAMPLVEWVNHTGCTTMTYFPALKKYIITISTTSRYPVLDGGHFDTWILEANDVTGPFAYVTFMKSFGPQVYFANFISKFSATTVSRAQWVAGSSAFVPSMYVYEAFLMYSANYDPGSFVGGPNPPNSGYKMNLQQSRFVLSDSFASRLAITRARKV